MEGTSFMLPYYPQFPKGNLGRTEILGSYTLNGEFSSGTGRKAYERTYLHKVGPDCKIAARKLFLSTNGQNIGANPVD